MPHCNTYSFGIYIFISQPELDDCNYLDFFLYSCTHEQLGQPLQQGGFFFFFLPRIKQGHLPDCDC